MIDSSRERGAFQRMVINAPVSLHQGAQHLTGICRDLSANGMGIFIETDQINPDEPIRINLATSSNLLPPFAAEARIIRITDEEGGYRLAVEFLTVA
ncbi:PilZ domain-containing protein [Aeromonas schubertii]|uniref:PilZ domain-containing protein n=1 Tax=Aeromonas schubertii TaxID=652 RepID=UPI000761501F|nr:PilZ domain-containing protein [Aeromonas schubertii]